VGIYLRLSSLCIVSLHDRCNGEDGDRTMSLPSRACRTQVRLQVICAYERLPPGIHAGIRIVLVAWESHDAYATQAGWLLAILGFLGRRMDDNVANERCGTRSMMFSTFFHRRDGNVFLASKR